MISAEEIVERIEGALEGALVTMKDLGGGNHWSAHVVALGGIPGSSNNRPQTGLAAQAGHPTKDGESAR